MTKIKIKIKLKKLNCLEPKNLTLLPSKVYKKNTNNRFKIVKKNFLKLKLEKKTLKLKLEKKVYNLFNKFKYMSKNVKNLNLLIHILNLEFKIEYKLNLSLNKFFGVSFSSILNLFKEMGFSLLYDIKFMSLNEKDIIKIKTKILEDWIVEGDLKRKLSKELLKYKQVPCRKNFRFRFKLPVNGQRLVQTLKQQKDLNIIKK